MSSPPEASIHSMTQSSSTQPEKVDVNVYGAPVSKNAGKIGSRIGKLVQIHVPISYESWDKVPQKYKDDVWNELLTFFELDSNANAIFFKKMTESYRQHKIDLRTNYYDKYDNDEDRSKNCPRTISQEDWDGFLINEAKPGANERRELGKKKRSLYNYVHHTGHTSHAGLEHEMAIVNPSKEITRREVWEKAHTKKDGTIPDSASSYFDKIVKAKEIINDSDEEALSLDEDIISQVLGKDIKGRTRSIGTKISSAQIKTSTITRKQLKKAKGDSEDWKTRMKHIEGALENQNRTLKTLVDMVTKRYTSQENQTPSAGFNEGGSSTRQDVVAQLNSLGVTNQNNCEILNMDSDVIATATVCRDSTPSIIHGNPVPSTQKKLVVDSILLPDERTSKQNHPLATTFGEVGIGGFVCHPKSFLRYL